MCRIASRAENSTSKALRGFGITTVVLALLAAGAAVAVERGILPGRVRLHAWLGLNGPGTPIPDVQHGSIQTASFHSAARGREVSYSIFWPRGARPTRLILALHGYGNDHNGAEDDLGMSEFQAEAIDAGVPAFAVVSVDAGVGFYHPFRGDDASAMILHELLPRLGQAGLDTHRIGLYGWSMGGYGALRLATLLGPHRVAGVAAVSAALWQNPSDAPTVSFAGAADYERYSVMHAQAALARIPLRIEVGDGDPFLNADREFVAGFGGSVALSVTSGGHTDGYWRSRLLGDLEFLGRRLAA